MLKNPLLSVIVPIYNVEDYLEDTIKSVIKQDIGFEENIELILMDDGSPDDSAQICLEYQKNFPNNIKYIKQDNAGVSAARNNGLKYASGKYVNFLDSDDILSSNAYSASIKFLESNEDKIDFTTLRVEFFDARYGDHPLNYKFFSSRVADINVEPDSIVLHVSACVFRRESVVYEFDSSIKISEDMKFLTEMVMQKQAYGIIKDATYFYRKRSGGGSAIDGSLLNRDYYQVTPEKVYAYILDAWKDGDGRPHIYTQNVVMYDLQWRLRQSKQSVLSDSEEAVYKSLIKLLIKRIDDKVILAQKVMSVAQKHYSLTVKYGGDLPKSVYGQLKVLANHTSPSVNIDFIRMENEQVEIEGWIPAGSAMHDISMKINGHNITLTNKETAHRKISFLGEAVHGGGGFVARIPVKDFEGDIKFYNNDSNLLGVITKRQSGIPNKRYGYRVISSMIMLNNINSIVVFDNNIVRHVFMEVRWWIRILGALRLRWAAKELYAIVRSKAKYTVAFTRATAPFLIPLKAFMSNAADVSLRVLYWAYRPFVTKPIWIISDRFLAAGDNGEALYRYVLEQDNTAIKVYFAISRKTKEYERLKKIYPNVVDSSGLLYRILFLHSSKNISSHADDFVINPFDRRVESFYDLFKFDFIFLQHGVIRNDMSAWLNRYNKNIKLFVTSAQQEYDSILDYNYYYTENEVLLSGLPRFDLLENLPKKKLILAPTWRHNLALPSESSDGKRPYNPAFKQSRYFKFFNELMNHPRLIQALKEYDMTGEFYLHPSFEPQIHDFESNDVFEVKDFPYSYKSAFREGSILVTDYSSVLFDFAYLKKPVVYAQFDQDEFYANQTIYTKGYMDDERDGFGPVAKDLESTVQAVIDAIESNCQMPEEYKKRVDEFYAYNDKNNRKRVYEAILKLEESHE